jgi:hypothetical protein
MKKTVRIGTLTLPNALHKEVKNGKPVSGKVTEEGKAARKDVVDYFKRQFDLDVVTKFTETANDNEGENPGFITTSVETSSQ